MKSFHKANVSCDCLNLRCYYSNRRTLKSSGSLKWGFILYNSSHKSKMFPQTHSRRYKSSFNQTVWGSFIILNKSILVLIWVITSVPLFFISRTCSRKHMRTHKGDKSHTPAVMALRHATQRTSKWLGCKGFTRKEAHRLQLLVIMVCAAAEEEL